MIILTCCDDDSKARFLKESTERVGLQYRYIIVTNWKSYVDKITQIQEAIRTLGEDEIVCFTDAYDILAFGTEDEIMTKFDAFNCELVISAELNCYPIENEGAYGYGDTNFQTNYKYVNSGGYIGYKRAITKLFEWKPIEEIHKICNLGGDQNYFTQYYLANVNSENICLDRMQTIFQSVYKLDYSCIRFENNRVFNTGTMQYPCFVHFNGYGGYNYMIIKKSDRLYVDIREVFMFGSKYNQYNQLDNYVPIFTHQFPNVPQIS